MSTRVGLPTGRHAHLYALLVLALTFSANAYAQTSEAPPSEQSNQDYLTGSWGGLRPNLMSQGVAFDAAYTVDAFANVRGGAQKHGAYLHNVDITLGVDANELMGWQGASFFGYMLGNYGDALSDYVGDLQGVSNIEAPGAWQLYEAWFQQNLFNDAVSVRMGLYDLNSEFASIETAGLYLGSSHGIGPDFSQSGLNGPSIFPATGFATRLLIQPTASLYAQTVLIEAVPGNGLPGTPRVQFTPGEGWLWASEAGIVPANAPGRKLGAGYWRYTKPFETLDGAGSAVGYGIYAIGEQALYDASREGARGASLYGRVGWASPEVHPIAFAWAAGVAVNGPFRSRPDDQFGLAVATAHQGSQMMEAMRLAGDTPESDEITFEITYSTSILPWIAIQPNIQYVHNPGGVATLNDAFVVGTRLGIAF
ncbi:MAG: carbohydrate porin [Rhodothermales bacterium]